MKSQLIRLNNKLNKKRIDYIEIQWTCDKNGRIQQQFINIMRYDDEYDYVPLTSAQFCSLFPNIMTEKIINFMIKKRMFWNFDTDRRCLRS